VAIEDVFREERSLCARFLMLTRSGRSDEDCKTHVKDIAKIKGSEPTYEIVDGRNMKTEEMSQRNRSGRTRLT